MSFSDEVRSRLLQPSDSGNEEPVRLPTRRFVDRSFYEAERAEVFGRTWLFTGRVDEIARPGLYMTWEKTTVPLLLVHAVDDVIRCFYNSCRHRGAPVVRVPRGRNRALRCQYHSWTYDTSGKLVSVPDERDFVDLHREERSLVPVACSLAGGAIFVNENPQEDLGSWLGPTVGEMSSVSSESLRTLDQRSITIPANWKRVLGNLLAAPLTPPRPGLKTMGTTRSDIQALEGGHIRIITPFDEETAVALGLENPFNWTSLNDEGLPSLPNLDPIFCSTATTYVLSPNLLVSFTPSGVLSFTAWPLDEETTLLDATWYAPDWGEEDSPANLPAWSQRLEWTQAQLDGIATTLESAQNEMKEPARQGLSLHYESEAFRLWNESLDARLSEVVPADTLTGAAPGEIRSPLKS
ncbi:MAG TPA: hypothetical protein DGL25_00150 [Dehalococcoidia bacterium]|nr:hypothetical protein [Dehalococcoidia bacterium]